MKNSLLILGLISIFISTSVLASENKYEVGDITRDEAGIEMVYVPGGTFTLGIDLEKLRLLCEQRNEPNPDQCVEIIQQDSGAAYLQTVDIQPFWIDRYEVTIEQFNKFCGGNANTDIDDCLPAPRDLELALNPLQPQIDVSWYTADFICGMRNARLPTEAEWEYAASGTDKHIFAWGDSFNPDFIQSSDSKYPQTYPVGSIAENQSWVGAFDLTGNVAEWNDDRFAPRILSHIDQEEWPSSVPGNRLEISRIAKGGSWNSSFWHNANFYRTNGSSDLMGFRCVRSLIPG
jgi:formylglycine-generating enzyme required for sulfatase activity